MVEREKQGEGMKDPTYIKELIEANPVWSLAFIMSEIDNDNAPLGWGKCIMLATFLLEKYNITLKEKKSAGA